MACDAPQLPSHQWLEWDKLLVVQIHQTPLKGCGSQLSLGQHDRGSRGVQSRLARK